MSEQLQEAREEQGRLRSALGESEDLLETLKGQLEEGRVEQEGLREGLGLVCAKVWGLEQSTLEVSDDGTKDPDTNLAMRSGELDVRVPVFRPMTHPVRTAIVAVRKPTSTRATDGGSQPTVPGMPPLLQQVWHLPGLGAGRLSPRLCRGL